MTCREVDVNVLDLMSPGDVRFKGYTDYSLEVGVLRSLSDTFSRVDTNVDNKLPIARDMIA